MLTPAVRSTTRRLAATLLACAAALGVAARPSEATVAGGARSALVVFAPLGERELAAAPGLSVGIMSAAQGSYSTAQFLLDASQGARVATSSYPRPTPPSLSLELSGAGGLIAGWPAARARARDAPQLLEPGLLASAVPGGAGYAGIAAADHLDAILATGRDGRIAAVSLGSGATLLARVAELRRHARLIVADLPGGAEGDADLRALAGRRPASELLLVIQRAADAPGHELLWSAAAGLAGGGGRELSSQSTDERGLIAAYDLAPTILVHLGLAIPADVRGKPIETDGPLRSASLRALMARLRVISARRLKALGFLLGAWALLLVGAACWPRASRRARERTPGRERDRAGARARAWALRAGALGVLWAPVAVLIPAALEPSAPVEYAIIALACIAFGALTDALLPWPRAPLLPALAALLALSVDALAGTQLLMRSLLGPDPILGARFYGIGNELKSGLAVLVAAAVAAALYPAVRGSRAALAMAGAGVLLALIEGSARIGAGVGGVILVSFAFALATVMLAPGALTRRRALLVLISPVVGLVALAALDLATAHGAGHFTGSVLDARSVGDVRDIIVRRYGAAWDELHNHAMPVAAALALVCAAFALLRRERLLAPVGGDPAWLAALAGGLAAGIVGALVEDSGPVLLVVATFALGCVLSYLWGRPRRESGSHSRLLDASGPRMAGRGSYRQIGVGRARSVGAGSSGAPQGWRTERDH
ncbi:MAG TPA: hypothetical protein VMF09_16330 [Solirubrobacteraceae bacterium]|nr:hypothetical protein [Solirubrobacteraceae bacterium]